MTGTQGLAWLEKQGGEGKPLQTATTSPTGFQKRYFACMCVSHFLSWDDVRTSPPVGGGRACLLDRHRLGEVARLVNLVPRHPRAKNTKKTRNTKNNTGSGMAFTSERAARAGVCTYVEAAHDGEVVRQQLQRHDHEQALEAVDDRRDADLVQARGDACVALWTTQTQRKQRERVSAWGTRKRGMHRGQRTRKRGMHRGKRVHRPQQTERKQRDGVSARGTKGACIGAREHVKGACIGSFG